MSSVFVHILQKMYKACRYLPADAAGIRRQSLNAYEQCGSMFVFIEIKGGGTLFMLYLYGMVKRTLTARFTAFS